MNLKVEIKLNGESSLDTRSENVNWVLRVVKLCHLLPRGVDDVQSGPQGLLEGHGPTHSLLGPVKTEKEDSLFPKCSHYVKRF